MDSVRKRPRSLVSGSSSHDSEEDVTILSTDANAAAPSAGTTPATEHKPPGTKPYNKAYRPVYSAEPVIRCHLPPHKPVEFKTYEQYERHCRTVHSNRCSACGLNFPDEHYLALHISEKHDPLEDSRRSRGEKTYRCLLPECDKVCSDRKKRRLHCIDKHMFPRNYTFGIIEYGIDHRRSMLSTPRRRNSVATATSTDTAESAPGRDNTHRGESGLDEEDEDDEEEDDEEGDDDEDEEEEDANEERDTTRAALAPIKMHGRPGFLHFPPPQIRGQRGYRGGYRGSGGRANGRGRGSWPSPAVRDPVSDITSSLSSLQFVPHSVMLKNKAKMPGNQMSDS
ncbi:hypothetical protein BCR34DRAFT_476315 [Clohesyomyces aquaticus]|uniref:C2H2-type domain-containing protein n=1 Tax=Clohesyomyces aquaticus TaxID=1231657 RepID=A0A1Y2A1V0_9PLEO|nr:hypothetical protein BCR34DRAFT_476315 [Clohesyomyces aquaticus]